MCIQYDILIITAIITHWIPKLTYYLPTLIKLYELHLSYLTLNFQTHPPSSPRPCYCDSNNNHNNNNKYTNLNTIVSKLFSIAYFPQKILSGYCSGFFLSFFFVFFYWGFLSQPFTNHRTAGEGRGHLFNFLLPLPPALQTFRH